MQQTVFKPKYQGKMILGLVSLIPIDAFLLWQLMSGKDSSAENIFGAIFLSAIIAAMPYAFVRRIVFDASSFSIERYLWPTKTVDYADIVDIGSTFIKTRNGNLAFQIMVNADELFTILKRLAKQGRINHNPIENSVVKQEQISRKALWPAGVLSFILWAVTSFVWPYKDSLFRDLSLIVFFVPIYFVMYYFLKNRSENE